MEPTQVQFTWAKAHLSSVYDQVDDGHGLRVIHRHKSRPLVLVGADDLVDLLDATHAFTTRSSRGEDGQVAIWLEELAIYGRGSDIDEAREDLLDELEVYVEEWEQRLHHAPDHAQRGWWVRRLQLAGDRESWRVLLGVDHVQEGPAGRAAAVLG
jgi:hypothetical protein